METPSSTRIVTRSHAFVSSAISENLMLTRRAEESENSVTKTRQMSGKKPKQDQSALVDVTNDSPIVGLALGNLETPSSAMSKKRIGSQACYTRTPGSGETLLRGQVKTLLQKVEEEAELSKITTENRPFFNLQGLINTPLYSLAAPTPTNTPQVLNFSENTNGVPTVTLSPFDDDKFLIPQMVSEMSDRKNREEFGYEDLITRSLLQDFSEKSKGSDSSRRSCMLIYQANARSIGNHDDEKGEDSQDKKCDIEYASVELEEKDYDDDGTFDELCEEVSRISFNGTTKFTGKHIRFVYNSDDELLVEEEMLSS